IREVSTRRKLVVVVEPVVVVPRDYQARGHTGDVPALAIDRHELSLRKEVQMNVEKLCRPRLVVRIDQARQALDALIIFLLGGSNENRRYFLFHNRTT